MLRLVRVLFLVYSVVSCGCRQAGILSYPFFHEDRYLHKIRQIRLVGELIGTVTENKNGLATIRMYNCLPKPLVANKTDEYVKICSINHITVGSILYTVGNQDIGIRFCGIIDITASNNSGGNIKIKLTKLSGVMDSVQIYYKKNASGGYDLAIKNPVTYGFHTAISNTYYITMDSLKFTNIEGWTLVN